MSITGNMTIPSTNYLKASLIDTTAAGALTIGGTTATSVSIGRTGQATNILGTLNVSGNETESGSLLTSTIDTSAAGALTIGGTTATGVNIGASSTSVIGITGNTTITGNASITGNTTITAGSALKTTTIDVPTGSTLLTVAGTTATTLTLGQSTTTLNLLGSSFLYVPYASYTPTLVATTTAPTLTYIFGSYTIMGKTMFLKIWMDTNGGSTAGTAGTGIYGFGIPSGYTINTQAYSLTPTLTGGKIVSSPLSTSNNYGGTIVGTGIANNVSSSSNSSFSVVCYDSTHIAGVNWSSNIQFHSSTFFGFGSSVNYFISYECSLPLV